MVYNGKPNKTDDLVVPLFLETPIISPRCCLSAVPGMPMRGRTTTSKVARSKSSRWRLRGSRGPKTAAMTCWGWGGWCEAGGLDWLIDWLNFSWRDVVEYNKFFSSGIGSTLTDADLTHLCVFYFQWFVHCHVLAIPELLCWWGALGGPSHLVSSYLPQ